MEADRDALASEVAQLREDNKRIQYNLDIMLSNERTDGASTNAPPKGQIRSQLGVALDRGFIPHGKALQGGLPGTKR